MDDLPATENHFTVEATDSDTTRPRKRRTEIQTKGKRPDLDGLQVEKGLKQFMVGEIVRSRPDFADYSLNLLQVGAYVSRGNKICEGDPTDWFEF